MDMSQLDTQLELSLLLYVNHLVPISPQVCATSYTQEYEL